MLGDFWDWVSGVVGRIDDLPFWLLLLALTYFAGYAVFMLFRRLRDLIVWLVAALMVASGIANP